MRADADVLRCATCSTIRPAMLILTPTLDAHHPTPSAPCAPITLENPSNAWLLIPRTLSVTDSFRVRCNRDVVPICITINTRNPEINSKPPVRPVHVIASASSFLPHPSYRVPILDYPTILPYRNLPLSTRKPHRLRRFRSPILYSFHYISFP